MTNDKNPLAQYLSPERNESLLHIHSSKNLYLGVNQNTQLPEYHMMDSFDHFLFAGGLDSIARLAIEELFRKRIQSGLGFIFIDGKAECGYLQMIDPLLSEFNRQDDLVILKDFEFDIVDAINSNKLVVLQFDNINRYLAELHAFINRLRLIILNEDEAIKPFSHVPLFLHGIEDDSNHFLGLHDSASHNTAQLNLFYLSETPHLLNEYVLANIRHKVFFHSKLNNQVIEDEMFDSWFEGFSEQLQSLSEDEALFIQYRDMHKLKITPQPVDADFI